MASEQDVVEIASYLAIERAGGRISLFDEPHENLYYEPDILAEIDSKQILFLVNGSDSFFASQKKVWRNVEEPFQAKSKKVAEKVFSVSFISSNAKNELFYVCSKFFDAQYILSDERVDWRAVLEVISEFSNENRTVPKKDLLARIRVNSSLLPKVLDELIIQLSEYIRSGIIQTSPEEDAFRLDTERVSNLKPFEETVLQSGASSDRKSFVALSLISMVKGVDVTPENILKRLAINTRFSNGEVISRDALKSSCIGLQESIGVGYSSLPTGFSIGSASSSLPSYLKIVKPSALIGIRQRMFECAPILEDLFRLCVDYDLVLGLVEEFRAASTTNDSLAKLLYECSNGEAKFSYAVRRNYILDLSLQCAGVSQTFVQQHCGIGRLTSVATREIDISLAQAEAIVENIFDKLSPTFASEEVARKYVQERYYSICTHSYCSPLYFQVYDILLKACTPESIFGFPNKNSEVVRCWHNDYDGAAGAIKFQFVVRDKNGIDKVLVRVCSAHEGHSADKRKEIAAKARLLCISMNDLGEKYRNDIKKVLVLDGDWRGPGNDPDRNLRMMHESGWDLIIGPDHFDVLEGRLLAWFAGGEFD